MFSVDIYFQFVNFIITADSFFATFSKCTKMVTVSIMSIYGSYIVNILFLYEQYMILFSWGIVIIWRVRLKCLFMDSDNQSGLVRGCHPTNKNIPLIEFLFKITTLDLSCWWSFKNFTSKFSFNLSKTVFYKPYQNFVSHIS